MTNAQSNASKLATGSPLTRRQVLQAGGVSLAVTATGLPRSGSTQAQEATPMPPGEEQFSADIQLELTAIVESALATTNTPGALVGVWYPGRGTWTAAMGIGDLETAAPITLDDHVRIASITKTFAATVILQLAEEGLLTLDDRLEDYITGIPNGADITLRQVLNMTAGIYNFINDPLIAVDYVNDPLLEYTPEDAIEFVRAHGVADFAPGTDVRYSDTNYLLLGMIIEQVTGRSAAAEITDRIIVPLGLTQTSVADTPDMPEPYAHGYAAAATGDPLRDVTRSNPAIPWTAGDIISTVADLRVWAEALATGTLLSPELQAERLDFQKFPVPGQEVGYGLGILTWNGFLGHNGGILGYSSWMVYEPQTRSTIVIVTNRSSTTGGTSDPIFAGVTRLLFPDRTPAPATPAATPAATPSA